MHLAKRRDVRIENPAEESHLIADVPLRVKVRPGSLEEVTLQPPMDKLTGYAVALGRERLFPSRSNADYLVLTERRKRFADWLQRIPGNELRVLDIGGRIQPYRPLLEGRSKSYIAIDPQPTGLVDAVGLGEHIPFADASFDLAVCTQVLCYASSPDRFIHEIWRVLRPGGALLLSAPAFFPFHAENDRWRFLPIRLTSLLEDFSEVEVIPEGGSVAGICRILAAFLDFHSENYHWRLRRLVKSTLVSLVNLAGERFDRFSHGDTRFTTNYCAFARKSSPYPSWTSTDALRLHFVF